jgi:hypothetical protein
MTGASPDFERGFAFALLGGAISLACPRTRTLSVSILLAVLFVALLEEGQNFIFGRHGRMHDFILKVLAVILCAAAVWGLRRLHRRLNYWRTMLKRLNPFARAHVGCKAAWLCPIIEGGHCGVTHHGFGHSRWIV